MLTKRLLYRKIPILSHKYDERITRTAMLEEVPSRAKGFKKVMDELSKLGVEWRNLSRLRIPPQASEPVSRYSQPFVNTGLQLVGVYRNLLVILEAKVGVYSNAAGYLTCVGPRKELRGESFTRQYSRINNSIPAALERLRMGLTWAE